MNDAYPLFILFGWETWVWEMLGVLGSGKEKI